MMLSFSFFVHFILDSYSLQERQFGKWNVGCMRMKRVGGGGADE
jgi:hypothetical protein